jgi:hypothetical protein
MTKVRRRTAVSYGRAGCFRWMAGVVAPLACLACSNVSTVEPLDFNIEVQGTITDVITGLPIDSAFVEVRTDMAGGFAESYADSTGQYAYSFVYRYFPGEIFCQFFVLVSAEDYLLEIFPLTCREGLQTVDYQLERAVPVSMPSQ